MDRKIRTNASVRKPAGSNLALTSRGLVVDRPQFHRRDQNRKTQAQTRGDHDRQVFTGQLKKIRIHIVRIGIGLEIDGSVCLRVLYEVFDHVTREVGRQLAWFEEQAACFVLERHVVRATMREVGGEHLQIDRPQTLAARVIEPIRGEARRVPQVLEGQRRIGFSAASSSLNQLVQPRHQRRFFRLLFRLFFRFAQSAWPAFAKPESVRNQAVHKIAIDAKRDAADHEKNDQQRSPQRAGRADHKRREPQQQQCAQQTQKCRRPVSLQESDQTPQPTPAGRSAIEGRQQGVEQSRGGCTGLKQRQQARLRSNALAQVGWE